MDTRPTECECNGVTKLTADSGMMNELSRLLGRCKSSILAGCFGTSSDIYFCFGKLKPIQRRILCAIPLVLLIFFSAAIGDSNELRSEIV